jgi:hypothetical protein
MRIIDMSPSVPNQKKWNIVGFEPRNQDAAADNKSQQTGDREQSFHCISAMHHPESTRIRGPQQRRQILRRLKMMKLEFQSVYGP